LQDPVLKAWAENRNDVSRPQQLFNEQLLHAADATNGTLDEAKQLDNFVSHSQDL
jgi:hypothetical protein